MEPWLKFDGRSVDAGAGRKKLVANNGGEFEVAADDVAVKNGAVHVHVGARANVTKYPPQKNTQPNPDAMMLVEGDCDRTACIGLVEVCCGSGRVLRACIGAWGC
jgi:hypothetical protein